MTAPVSFDQLVAEVETLARTHAGQARQTVLAAFGGPFLDPFDSAALDRALRRVHEARNDAERAVARAMLAKGLARVQSRSRLRDAS